MPLIERLHHIVRMGGAMRLCMPSIPEEPPRLAVFLLTLFDWVSDSGKSNGHTRLRREGSGGS